MILTGELRHFVSLPPGLTDLHSNWRVRWQCSQQGEGPKWSRNSRYDAEMGTVVGTGPAAGWHEKPTLAGGGLFGPVTS